MGYQKQNFVDCQVLNSAQLNHIEDGIVDLESNSNTTLAGKADKSEVQANADGIAAEASRAKGEEQRLDAAITAETTRAQAAEKANADNIEAEVERAQTAESDLSTKITEETERAKAAEQANADGIAAEASRAKDEEQRLDTAITAETTRAEQAEQALDTRTVALESCGFVVVDGKVCMKYRKS